MNIQRFMIVPLLVAGLGSLSCGGTKDIQLMSSADIPAAQSTVKVSTTDNGNTRIDLAVEHLAAPERVSPGATVYVVWARGSAVETQSQNLGALKVDDDLKGTIVAVTPLHSFELYITAEPSQMTETPTGKTLLYTTVAMK